MPYDEVGYYRDFPCEDCGVFCIRSRKVFKHFVLRCEACNKKLMNKLESYKKGVNYKNSGESETSTE